MKSTATVKHRDHVPYGWIALEFCSVNFAGPRADELGEAWRKIEYSKLHDTEAKIKKLEGRVEAFELDKKILKTNAHKKPWYYFWKTKEEKELAQKLDEYDDKIYQLQRQIEKLEKEKFFDSYTLRHKAEKFLEEHGFYLHSTSSSGDECVTHTEIYWSDN